MFLTAGAENSKFHNGDETVEKKNKVRNNANPMKRNGKTWELTHRDYER